MSLTKGFTLVELLISMVVLTVLAAGVIGLIGQGPRQYARDIRRQADLQTFASALELYRNDNSTYPPCLGGGASCQALSSNIPAINGTYVQTAVWPTDPSGSPMFYRYTPFNSSGGACAGTPASRCVTYTICAGSEKGGTSQNGSCGGLACGSSGEACVFVVRSP